MAAKKTHCRCGNPLPERPRFKPGSFVVAFGQRTSHCSVKCYDDAHRERVRARRAAAKKTTAESVPAPSASTTT